MEYKIDKTENNLKILGKDFLKNNRNKSKLILKNRKYNIKEVLEISDIKEDKLKIKMMISADTINISNLFKECKSLIEFSVYNNFENIEFIGKNDFFEEKKIYLILMKIKKRILYIKA